MAATNTQSLYRQVLVTYGLMLAAFFVGSFFPEQRVWGISWYAYFGWPGRLLLIGAGVMLPFVATMLVRKFPVEATTAVKSRTYYIAISVLIALFGLAFYLFQVRTHFLGDGYLLLSRLFYGTELVKPWEAFVFEIQNFIYSMSGRASEEDARFAFQLIAYASGISFLGAAAVAARRLFASMWDRLIFILGMASGGYMLLFFGYVENYSLFVLAVTLFSLAGLLAAQGKLGPVLVLIPMIAAVFLHPFGLALLPAAAWLVLRRTSVGQWLASGSRLPRLLVWGAIAVAFDLAFLYLYTENYFFRFSFVPPVADIFTVGGYTLFSGKHLLDFVNLMILLVPGLLLFTVVLVWLPLKQLWRRGEYRFLLLLVLPTLAITFAMDPKLGMPRDWDLFCFAGVPLGVAGFFTLVDNKAVIKQYVPIALLAIGLGLMILAPRVATQVIPEKAVALFDHQADLDVRRSGTGRFLAVEYFRKLGDSEEVSRRKVICGDVLLARTLVDSARVFKIVGKSVKANAKFRQAIAFNPSYSFSWANLGYEFIEQGKFDSALTYFLIADGFNPYNYITCNGLGIAYAGLGDDERAEDYWLLSRRANPRNLNSRTLLLDLYQRQNRQKDYDRLSK